MNALEITVNTSELRAAVQANRDRHRAEYEKALKSYEHAMRAWFEEQLQRLLAGKSWDRNPPHPAPEDHTDDYDQLIGMLTMSVNETMDLDWSTYRQFVDDEWGWSRATQVTNSYYAAMVQ